MHVGLITPTLDYSSGWGTYSLSLIQALHKHGVATTVACLRDADTAEADFEVHHILDPVPRGRLTGLKMLRRVPSLRYLFKDCDVIHSTIEALAPLAYFVAGKRPYFVTAHGTYVNLPIIQKIPVNSLYKRSFRKAHLICVSSYTAKAATKIIPNAKTHVIHNGVDINRFHQTSSRQLKTVPTVITCGGVKFRKGTLPLVKAMAIVRKKIPTVKCLVMGNIEPASVYTAEVKHAITRLNLEQTVQLMGFVEDNLMRDWLAEADIMVLPSLNQEVSFEGFGLVLLEAGASGTPVIGTDNCGIEDAIDHNQTGLIVAQDNIAQELPEAIISLLSNPKEAARMGQAGRVKASQQTWDTVAQQIIAAYKSALSSKDT